MRAYLKQPLVISTLVAMFCGLITLAQPLDQGYWNTRYRFGQKPAPQSVVLVTMDAGVNASDREVARVLNAVAAQHPQHIYLDRKTYTASPELQGTIDRLGPKLSLVARFAKLDRFDEGSIALPPERVVPQSRLVVSGFVSNFLGYGVSSVVEAQLGGKTYPSLAAAIANRSGGPGDTVRPDFTVDPQTVRMVSSDVLLSGAGSQGALTGRTVIVKEPRSGFSDLVGYFAHRRVDPVFLDIALIEALREGPPIDIDWFVPIVLCTVMIFMTQQVRSRRLRRMAYAVIAFNILIGPALLDQVGVVSNPAAAIVELASFAGIRVWTKWRQAVLQTSRSGLPNFLTLTQTPLPPQHDVIVAVIGRYEEFLATLPADLHGECARQIARRFAVGCGARDICHGEGGLFAWIEPTRPLDQQIENLEGLRALFAAPLLVGQHVFDTNVHFGLERNHEFDGLTRVNTAVASATEALKRGRTVELFEAQRLANAAWELSLLTRIDEGMRNGDIWLAYQPQWDYREGRISGAEALIRWNDPVRGPIRPDEFILQAEQAGRIDALTYWVLDQVITATERFNALGPTFQVSINLSAQLVDKPSLISSVAEIVRRRGIDCRLLTVEVTETAGMCNRPAAIRNLQALRSMGFRLSIDDFGTGEASLSYLAELPSDELKLDRRFVSKIVHHERERHIVASTINLAHALRQIVVAEGVEDLSTFELLRQLGCDVGQGYHIAKPEPLELLLSRYATMAEPGTARAQKR
ncbi:EAL domain-containing protein [Novosphingobium aerophilum]|uniref:EAL domain-containing protein n=1 Tax=Novosphingobium aerophilum TaxID=2839843 RepID=UPI001FCFAA7D|nr:EAL domain-containing protein [Novosphingobium aerophilum]